MWFIMHLCRFLIGTIVYLQCRRAGAGCLCASRQVRPCDVILTWDIGSRQTLDKTYVGGRQSKTSFLLILNIDFKMLYCSLWRPGCSASAGNMICYNEWNKLKQECLPSLFKLNLYLAQSVSGGLIQGVTNIITTLNLIIRLFHFWKIWLGCGWWGVPALYLCRMWASMIWSACSGPGGDLITSHHALPWHHIVSQRGPPPALCSTPTLLRG